MLPGTPCLLSRVLIAVNLLGAVSFGFSVRPNTESNDIQTAQENISLLRLPTCRRHSACAYLQVNTKGINVQPLCACAAGRKCPLVWDNRDGHSVSQDSDQYKFCERVPQDIGRCSPVQLAYTSEMAFSKESNELEILNAQVLCSCPEHHVYEFLDMQEKETSEHELLISKYTCQMLKTCELSDMCRELTESPDSFLVKDVCSCPRGLTCPGYPEAAFQSEVFGKGAIYMIRCQ